MLYLIVYITLVYVIVLTNIVRQFSSNDMDAVLWIVSISNLFYDLFNTLIMRAASVLTANQRITGW